MERSADFPKVFRPESGSLTPEWALLTIMRTNYGKKKKKSNPCIFPLIAFESPSCPRLCCF